MCACVFMHVFTAHCECMRARMSACVYYTVYANHVLAVEYVYTVCTTENSLKVAPYNRYTMAARDFADIYT